MTKDEEDFVEARDASSEAADLSDLSDHCCGSEEYPVMDASSKGWPGSSRRFPNMISENLIEFAHHRESDWIDLLARQLHVVIAAKLRRDPNLLGIPLYNLRLWKKTADAETKLLLRQWKLILMTWPLDEILEFLVADTPESSALRKCSPFCGILTPTEIASVWQASAK